MYGLEMHVPHKKSRVTRIGLMGSEKIVKFPFQIISMDILGPLPRSMQGNTNLLVVTDWFTKYVLLFPLKHPKAAHIVKLVEQVFLIFGVPQFIICDNGTQFAGRVFKSLVEEYQVQKI